MSQPASPNLVSIETLIAMPPAIFTMHEAAERLHKSRRWLQDWLREHPADRFGRPFYAPLGRTKVFTDDDLRRILIAAMEDERCRLDSSRHGRRHGMRHGEFAAPTSASTLTDARALARKHSPRKSAENSNATSKVVSLPTNKQPPLRQPPRHT
jgi:hypothetical protein